VKKFERASVSTPFSSLTSLIRQTIAENGGWLPFDRYMSLALYTPGLGYYARGNALFGALPQSGSDFVTAPELSPLFGHTLARAIGQALHASGTSHIYEFGAGSGALAEQLLTTLGDKAKRYTIVELSGALRARQQTRLSRFGHQVQWLDTLPSELQGAIVGNEVLDAMPVQLLCFDGAQWLERGVVNADAGFGWADRPTSLKPPFAGSYPPGYVTEIHPQAEAFITTVAERLTRGAAYFIDYGFPEAEYYHPQRDQGTVMCHRAHRADADPLADVGEKDITAHVNFTAMALAAQNAGVEVLGYTSQAHFLINCGLVDALKTADLPTRANAQKLITEHEMGELFKVVAFAKGCEANFMLDSCGFSQGDRTHTL
jgi:SAM-dependent MidA family methyltransferase